MRNLLAAFARNTVFANIVLAMVLLAGFMAAWNMVRETFPEFSLDIINVRVVWPGADPEEVEEGICRKIEEAVEGIDGIKQYDTISSESLGSAVIEIHENYDIDYVKERVRNAVDAISTFPEDAEQPIIEELLIRAEVCLIALSGRDMTERDLKEWAEQTKEELRTLPGVSQVQVLGTRDYEIAIEVSEEKLREYGLTFGQVARLVRASSLNLSGGTMRTQGEEIRLRTMGRKYTAKEFAEIVLLARPNGDVITVERIADIKDEFIEDQVISRFNGEPTVTIQVLKTTEEDTLSIDREVQAYVARKQAELPEGISIKTWGGTVKILESRIALLVRNGLIGLTVVFVALWLFLDLRLSFWAGMGMPISVMGAMAIMWGMGETINMISLFGLIMVLGIIVDDAIVVGEAIYVARKDGAPPLKAAVDGVLEVGMPVVGAVTTTIVAFLPLMFVSGIMGKFIFILPVVVIACLAISLLECLILLPAHLSHLPDPKARVRARNPLVRFGRRFHYLTNHGLEWFVAHVYEPFMRKALHWRYVSLAVAVAVLLMTMGLLQSGLIKFQFFPSIDADDMIATVEFPNGTPLSVTQDAVHRLEEAVKRLGARTETRNGEPLIENIFTLVGSSIDEFSPKTGSHVGSVQAQIVDSEHRTKHCEALLAEWEAEVGGIPGAVSLTFQGREAGPPGAPIEIWFQGHDMAAILAAAEELKAKLTTYDGVYQIQHDFRPGKNEMKLRLKPQARALGITVADLAGQIYAGYFGEEAIRLQRGRDDIRVRVRYPAEERSQVAEFERIRIRTPLGHEVPLLSVADIEFGPGYASIKRTDGMRRVSVTAEVNYDKANTNEIMSEMESSYLPALMDRHRGVLISLQGEKKNMRESLGSLGLGYPLALLGIFVIIATIFRSYLQPLIIMVTVPFGIIGAVFGHMLLGYDLTIMSLFGMVALSGVVVNDAIVLIECINNYIADGTPFYEAIRRGGARRFRAIFLTTVSTIGGLTPLMLEKDMQARFLIPMAIAVAAGVAFATLLTLLLEPCLLCILNDFRRIARWMSTRKWPAPEEVEPARLRRVGLQQEGPGAASEAVSGRQVGPETV